MNSLWCQAILTATVNALFNKDVAKVGVGAGVENDERIKGRTKVYGKVDVIDGRK